MLNLNHCSVTLNKHYKKSKILIKKVYDSALYMLLDGIHVTILCFGDCKISYVKVTPGDGYLQSG